MKPQIEFKARTRIRLRMTDHILCRCRTTGLRLFVMMMTRSWIEVEQARMSREKIGLFRGITLNFVKRALRMSGIEEDGTATKSISALGSRTRQRHPWNLNAKRQMSRFEIREWQWRSIAPSMQQGMSVEDDVCSSIWSFEPARTKRRLRSKPG